MYICSIISFKFEGIIKSPRKCKVNNLTSLFKKNIWEHEINYLTKELRVSNNKEWICKDKAKSTDKLSKWLKSTHQLSTFDFVDFEATNIKFRHRAFYPKNSKSIPAKIRDFNLFFM